MANSMPSMLALLGLVAVAGYQNRDKIAEVFEAARRKQPPQMGDQSAAGKGAPYSESSLVTGLGELISRLKSSGLGQSADSWVSTGANRPIEPVDLETAIGEETLSELSERTGFSRAELIDRLSATLPDAIDRITPDGRVPVAT